MCYLIKHLFTELTILTCFVPNLEVATTQLGFEWSLPNHQEQYLGVTIHPDGTSVANHPDHYILLRPPVAVSTISHEITHVLNRYPEKGDEPLALAAGHIQQQIINICLLEEIPLYLFKLNDTAIPDTLWINTLYFND